MVVLNSKLAFEIALKQIRNGLHRLLRVFSHRRDSNFSSLFSRQHHDAHNALPVDLFDVSLRQKYIRSEP